MTSRKDQAQYWSNEVRPYRYVSVKQFAERFQQFHVGINLAEELAVPYDRELSHNAALTFDRYGVSNRELFKANFSRELLLMKQQSFVHVFKAVQVRTYLFNSIGWKLKPLQLQTYIIHFDLQLEQIKLIRSAGGVIQSADCYPSPNHHDHILPHTNGA